jgi:AcrR family transcriptional regulator
VAASVRATGSATVTVDQGQGAQPPATTSTVSYSYFPTGQREALTYPDAPAGGSAKVGYSYDQTGAMASLTDWYGKTTTFSHDPDGNTTATAYPDGVDVSDSFDRAGSMTALTATASDASVAAGISYALDSAEQVSAEIGTGALSGSVGYSYDMPTAWVPWLREPLQRPVQRTTPPATPPPWPPAHQMAVADVAEAAGVTRALVYRYYPNKRELFAAVFQRAANQLVEASAPRESNDLMGQVLAGLEAHFDFFESNARTVLVANRGELAGDPMIEAIITDELARLRTAMLDTMGLTGRDRYLAGTALLGWLAYVWEVCVDWLAERRLSRAEVRNLCLRTLLAALTPNGLGDETDLRELVGTLARSARHDRDRPIARREQPDR